MATILGLALKVTGDASGLAKSLDPVDRALASIGKQVERATAVFAPFTAASGAAATAQQEFADRFAVLAEQFKDNKDAVAYADAFAKLADEASRSADVFERGIQTTAKFATEQQDAVGKVTLLVEELRAGAIEAPTFERALAALSGVDLSSSEDAARFIRVLAENARDGSIDIERAAASLRQLSEAQTAASGGQSVLAASTRQANLQLSELSGLLSLVPGGLGAVAGRVSALSGAVQGFEKLSAGGLTRAVDTLGSSFGALASPVGIGIAAVAGFGAATSAIVAGLVNLEGRVEALGFAAQQAGTDFQTIQVLDEAAKRTGTSVDGLASGVQKFAVTINEARDGSGKAAEAFRELGISQEALANGTPVQLAEQTAEALAKIEDPARRSALQVELLGKSGETLRRGFSAFTEAESALGRFNATLSDVDRDLIASLGTAFDDVQTAISGLTLSVLKPFIDIVGSGAGALSGLIGLCSRLADVIGTILGPVINGFADGLKIVGLAFEGLNAGIDIIFGTAEKTIDKVGQVRREAEAPLNKGFAKDFAKAMEGVNAQLSKASFEAQNFGVVGARAFAQYQRTLETLQKQFSRKVIDEAAFERAINRANESYRKQIDLARQTAEEVDRKVQADRAASDEMIKQQQILRDFNGDTNRAEAADKVLQLEREIARVRQEISTVNPFGDVAKAGEERILQLQKIVEQQKEIASGDAQIANDARTRIDGLLKASQERSDLEEQVLAASIEQGRLEKEITTAIVERRNEDAAAATARLAQVDQLRAKLEDQQSAAELGFGDSFAAGFADANKAIADATQKAIEFGDAGIAAAAKFQEGIAKAQEQAKDGILNKEAYDQELAAQRNLFDERLAATQRVNDIIRRDVLQVTDEERQAQQGLARLEEEIANRRGDIQNRLEVARQNGDKAAIKGYERQLAFLQGIVDKEAELARGKQQVDALLNQNANARQQIDLQAANQQLAIGEQVAQRQLQAAANIQRVQADIALTEDRRAAAIEKGDLVLARQLTQRLQQLDQVEAKENDIANNRNKAEAAIFGQRQKNEEFAQKQAESQQQALQQQQQAAEAQQQAVSQEQARIAEERRRAEEAEFARQQERVRQLNTLGSATVNTSDVRTAAGAALVLDLAASAQDPELIEARIQTKLLNQIALGLAGAASNYFNQPVAIVGAARLGGFG